MGDEDERTLYVGNLSDEVTEEILYELFLQAGPVKHVKIPFDKISNRMKNFGFVCFKDEESVPYALYLLEDMEVFGRNIRVQTRRNTMTIPPKYCAGIHSLDPEINKMGDMSTNVDDNSTYARGSNTPTRIFNSMYQNTYGHNGTPPLYNGTPPLFIGSPAYPPIFNRTPTIDTHSLNLLKNAYGSPVNGQNSYYNNYQHHNSPRSGGNYLMEYAPCNSPHLNTGARHQYQQEDSRSGNMNHSNRPSSNYGDRASRNDHQAGYRDYIQHDDRYHQTDVHSRLGNRYPDSRNNSSGYRRSNDRY